MVFVVLAKPFGRGTAVPDENMGMELPRRAPTREQFGKPVPGSISTILRLLKSSTTLHKNLMQNTPGYALSQRNDYEHILRDEAELIRTQQYILDNPTRWDLDRNNPKR